MTSQAGLGISDDHELAGAPLQQVYDVVVAADTPDTSVIFISRTNFRSIGALGALESQLHKPVLSAVQASMWHCLNIINVDGAKPGYGSLADLTASPRARLLFANSPSTMEPKERIDPRHTINQHYKQGRAMKNARLGRPKRLVVSAFIGIAAMTATACGSSGGANQGSGSPVAPAASTGAPPQSSPSQASSASGSPSAGNAITLPARYASAGKITWATEPYYPPFQLTDTDNKTLIGIDIELANKISELLGVKAEIVEGTFDSFIPGIQAKRYDVAIDAMADNDTRRQQVNFIDYFQSGSAIFVPKGNPKNIKSIDDLCGMSVGLLKGTFQVTDADTQSDKCVKEGKAKLTSKVYPDQGGQLLSLTSARVDAILMDSAAGSYAAKQASDSFELTGNLTSSKRKGIIISKDDADLMTAVQQALQQLMDDGTYKAILEKWGQSAGAIPKATINDGAGQ